MKYFIKKQIGFTEGHSTEHAIIGQIGQIKNSFRKNHFTLGVFIDLSKAFDTVDHHVVLTMEKMETLYVRFRATFIITNNILYLVINATLSKI